MKDVLDSPILSMIYMVVEDASVWEKDSKKEALEFVQRCQRMTKGILREGEFFKRISIL